MRKQMTAPPGRLPPITIVLGRRVLATHTTGLALTFHRSPARITEGAI
jgi:hypothetical protein